MLYFVLNSPTINSWILYALVFIFVDSNYSLFVVLVVRVPFVINTFEMAPKNNVVDAVYLTTHQLLVEARRNTYQYRISPHE